MRPLFLDPSVLLLAVGGEHPRRSACRTVLRGAVEGHFGLHLSVEGGQEFLFHRLRRTDPAQAVAQFNLLDDIVFWHTFDERVLRHSLDLVARGDARGRDAVHAATAIGAGFDAIVSTDADFDAIPGLRRLQPENLSDDA